LRSAGRQKTRISAMKLPLAVKGLALIFLICLLFRTVSVLGADTAASALMNGMVSNESIVHRILSFELGGGKNSNPSAGITALMFETPVFGSRETEPEIKTETPPAVSDSAAEVSEDISVSEDGDLYYTDDANAEAPAQPTDIPVYVDSSAASGENGISIKNNTDYALDVDAMLKEPLNISLSGDSPAVLIIHTHSSECYTPAGDDNHVESDPYRTQEKRYSVIRVGDELAAEFEKRGISTIHDRGVYDYPSYAHSYTKSYDAIQWYLGQYPSIKIVIDLHRDAIASEDGTYYKTFAQVGDVACSQVMFVMGSDASGLEHPKWRENFNLALHLQAKMNELYPSLAKPIRLSQYRYNQQATLGSMILEVGSCGNTLDEALTAVRYFADAASQVILDLYPENQG
jgi:stage II sporulation protein P